MSAPRFSFCISVFVEDTGMGIKKEHQSEVFFRFRKIENEEQDQLYSGAGLGLSLSKRLVELLGGEMSLQSEYGKGTTFRFTIQAENFLF